MSPRPVLIIHADESRRRELRALLTGREVLEATSRAEALPLLGRGPLCLVVSHPHEFRRLLRDLERCTPGTPRAVLCPDDEAALRQLSELASEGYDFSTVHEHSPESLRALVEARASARVVPLEPLQADFTAGGIQFRAEVVDVGNEGLGLRLPSGAPVERLTPGLRLEQAQVSGPSGEVLEQRTWLVRTLRRAADGSRRVHVGVTIEPQPPRMQGRPPVTLRDEVRIRGLVHRALNRDATFTVRLSDDSRSREYTRCAPDAAGRLVLSAPRPGSDFREGEIALVSFELLGSQVEAVTAILEAGRERLVLAQPRTAHRRDRREALRVKLPEAWPGSIAFRSALTGVVLRQRLVDLHPGGCAFVLEGRGETLPPGLRLMNVELELDGRRCRCEAIVQTSRALPDAGVRQRVGLRLLTSTEPDRQVLVDAWLGLLAPNVSCGSKFGFPAVWRLFEDEEVRFPDHPLGDPTTVEVLGRRHRAIGDGRHGLGKSFVFNEDGAVLGHASGLRTHSRTWLSQHLVVKTGYHRQTHVSQSLVNLSFDYAEALGDVEYLRGLWRTSNRWTSRVYGTATARLVLPGLSYVASFTPLRVDLAVPREVPRRAARATTAEERAALLHHLRRTWDPVRLRADDLFEGELGLKTLSARCAGAGIERSRHVGVVEGEDGPRGWVLIERMTSGLFWAEWYDAFRLVLADPAAPDADETRHALVHYALADARARGRTHTHCLAEDADIPWLERAGFANLGRVMEFCAHRSMNREMTAQMLAIFDRLAPREARARYRDEGAEP